MFETVVVIPVPPTNASVSLSRETVSVPLSPEMDRSVEIDAIVAEVILPCASIVRTGTCVEEPYVFATTPVLSRLKVTELLATTEVRPTPPAKFRVSSASITLSDPESPVISRFEEAPIEEISLST